MYGDVVDRTADALLEKEKKRPWLLLKHIKDKKKHEEEMNALGTVGVDVTGNVESGEL